jgi:hypothetical protein
MEMPAPSGLKSFGCDYAAARPNEKSRPVTIGKNQGHRKIGDENL